MTTATVHPSVEVTTFASDLRRHDLRLVPAALSGWAVVLCGLYFGPVGAAGLGFGGLVVAGAAALRGRGSVVVAMGGMVAALALVVGTQTWQVQGHPVHAYAQRASAATVVVHLRDDPRAVASAGYGGRQAESQHVVIRAELEWAQIAGQQWHIGGRMLLLTPAQGWTGLLPGQRVKVTGLLATADRPDLTVAVLRTRGKPEVLSAPTATQRAAERVRAGLRMAVRVLDPEPAGLLPALVAGDTSAMVPAVQTDFRTAGLAHLVAVSGTNVAIICGAVLGLARLARLGPRSAVVLAGVVLFGFVVLCRPSPSVLRAAVMGAVALLALLLGRRRSAVPALCAAVLVLLMVDPAFGTDPGFALSVLATSALVLLAPAWVEALRRRGVPPGVAEALAVPAAAHAVTAPVVAGLSGQVSLVAIVTNMLAAPAVVPATVLGVLAAVVGALQPGVAVVLVQLAGPAVSWLVGLGHQGAAVSGAVVRWPAGPIGALLLTSIIMVLLVAMRAYRLRVLAAAGLVGALLILVPTRFVTPGWPAVGWVMVSCDVGQGDAAVLATADSGRAVLVDAGPDPATVSACLNRLGVRRLALVVISHLHADHIGGLAGVLRGRMVGAIALGPGRSPPWAFAQVRRVATAAQVPLVALIAGQRLSWPGLTLDVLAPLRDPPPVDDHEAEVEGTAVNNTSVVLRATTTAGRLLLTGDVELDAQADLLANSTDLRADVLKVPHHGSRYSVEEFLAAVHPRVAIISVGAHNQYGHPSQHVIDALARPGTRVMRTDLSGDIAIVGGRSLHVVARGPDVAMATSSPKPERKLTGQGYGR